MCMVMGSIKTYVHYRMLSCKLKINGVSTKYLILCNSSIQFSCVELRSATEVMRSL